MPKTIEHHTASSFWKAYHLLPKSIQDLSDKSYCLLKSTPHHRSLYFKKVKNSYWSVRIGLHYRAIGLENKSKTGYNIIWFWIGTHEEYNKIFKKIPE